MKQWQLKQGSKTTGIDFCSIATVRQKSSEAHDGAAE